MRSPLHRESLQPHPSNPASALHQLHVEVDWREQLALHYELRGNMDALRIPAPSAPQRTDELWRHTCCELFVAVAGVPGYIEFNFSPGGPWAAYRFDGYRTGMRPLQVDAPSIASQLTPAQLDVRVSLNLAALPWLASVSALQCALTAVIEEHSGTRSFWALAHPAAQPDFHHLDGFALRLSKAR